jgi:type II secretory pathway component PulC
MLPWIIQMSILSLILIVLVHYLFTFFKTNLTIPKVKDLVNKPQKQYEALFDTMKESNNIKHQPVIETTDNMKNELKNYLKEILKIKFIEIMQVILGLLLFGQLIQVVIGQNKSMMLVLILVE